MKVAIFTELYPPHLGGQEIRFAEIGETLVAKGHKVSVFCIGHDKKLPKYEVKNGVEVHRFPYDENYTKPVIKSLKRRLLPLIRYSLWCRKIAVDQDFDLHIYNQWPIGHVMMAPKKVRNKSIIDWCEIRENQPFKWLQKNLPLKMKYNIAVSMAVKENIQMVSGQKVEYIPSGVYTNKYMNKAYDQRSGLLYLGRLTEHKNIGLLIKAYKKLKLNGFTEKLIIAGKGPAYDNILNEVKQEGLVDSIDVLGAVSENEKIQLLASSKLLVIPSKREGFPRVVAEAMASGLPVATVDYPENGTKTVVSQYNVGLVSKPEDSDLANTIMEVLHSWSSYSEIALKEVNKLDWNKIVEEIEKIPNGRGDHV